MYPDLLQGLLIILLGVSALLLPFIIAIVYHKYKAILPFSIPVKYRRIVKSVAFIFPLCGVFITCNYSPPPVLLGTICYLVNSLCLSVIINRVNYITKYEMGYSLVIFFYYFTSFFWMAGFEDM